MVYKIKGIYILSLLCFAIININSTFSQSYNSSGNSDSANNVQISWSIGETFIIGSDKASVGNIASTELRVEEITSNNKMEELNISLYPNPTKDYVYLEMDEDVKQYSISLINTAGIFLPVEIVYNQNGKTLIPVQNLQNGIYYLSITEDKTQIKKSFKIIKR